MKRITTALLITAMLASLASCGGTSGGDDTTAAQGSDTTAADTEPALTLPDYKLDLGGDDFTVLYFDHVAGWGWNSNTPSDIKATDEETGDVLSDAVFRRNRKVEEMYNCKIQAIGLTGSAIYNDLEKSVMANDGAYDAALPVQQGFQNPVANGILVQLDGLFDFGKPWWDSNSLEGLTVCGKTYGIAGDLTFMDKLIAIGVFFNKNMAEDYKLGDIYQLVIDGKWTFDKMLELGEVVSADLDGNEVYNINDRFGFSGQNDAVYEFLHSSGERFCTVDKDGIPYMSNASERAVNVLTRIYEFMGNSQQFFNRQQAGLSVADTIKMFMSDQVLFIMRPLSTLFDLRAMNAEFGIIPTPKMDDSQDKYYTSIGYTGSPVVSIPVDAKSVENSAKVLDTLCAESYFSVNSALYDMVLGAKLTRDESSTENLDIILNNRIYDAGCIFGFGGMAGKFMTPGDPGTVVSTIESYKSVVQADIDKLVDALSE